MHRLPIVLAAALAAAPAPAAQPPNVLLVITDDQGWGDVRSHGNDNIDTPVLDRLAAEGARFERFFVSPVCAPTRAALLAGRWHLRTGTCWVTRGLETMRAGETTLAEALKKAGYATGCFGKWHNGAHYPGHPNGQGFDEFFGFCGGHLNNYFDARLERNGDAVETKGYITDVLTDAALEFIERHRERPFLCYVAYNAPHGPFQVPDRQFDKYRARGLDARDAAIYGMCENADENIGRLLRRIDELELRERTIVIFLTDNGPNGARFNGGMRGTKGSVHEGGVRVPLFIRWPARIAAGRKVERIASAIDLLPTILDLCGVAAPAEPRLDGISLAPLLAGEAAGWPDRLLFTHQSRRGDVEKFPGAVRTERWRLVGERRWELFDMQADPGETRDVSAEHPEVAARLIAAYEEWFRDVTRDGNERPPIPVGHPERPRVELPAPEA